LCLWLGEHPLRVSELESDEALALT